MPVRHVLLSTATGIFPAASHEDLGGAYRFASFAALTATTDHTVVGTVEGTIGGSDSWTTVLTLTTGNSTGLVSSTGSDLPVFDKLRINLSANNSTAEMPAWLAASD